MTAWERCRRFGARPEAALGIACTASLATTVPKRGTHRVIVALQSLEETLTRRSRNPRPGILLVEADASVSYGFLMGISDLARRSGMTEIVLSTLPASTP